MGTGYDIPKGSQETRGKDEMIEVQVKNDRGKYLISRSYLDVIDGGLGGSQSELNYMKSRERELTAAYGLTDTKRIGQGGMSVSSGKNSTAIIYDGFAFFDSLELINHIRGQAIRQERLCNCGSH